MTSGVPWRRAFGELSRAAGCPRHRGPGLLPGSKRVRSLFLNAILAVRHLARVPAAAVGGGVFALLLACGAVAADAVQPRIVNLYNFIRNSDSRLQNSEEVLFNATRQQIELIKPTHMPATWALQYDALINPRYQKLLKEQLGPQDEIAAWWELPRQLVQKAGLKWRGHDHDWDWAANIGFSPGYAPDERRKLVDVYMADFKEIFGYYPKSVGSWFIDEVTLEHMVGKYGIVASCNCKDQVGTDGYTLIGETRTARQFGITAGITA